MGTIDWCMMSKARAELAIAERDGDLAKAGELTHAVLPRLTKELEQVPPSCPQSEPWMYGSPRPDSSSALEISTMRPLSLSILAPYAVGECAGWRGDEWWRDAGRASDFSSHCGGRITIHWHSGR